MGVRATRKQRGFAMVQNAPLRDRRLGLKAKGLYAIMVSLPDTWEYTVSGLAKVCGVGRDCIRSTLLELERAGYLERHQSHSRDGRFSRCEYVLYPSSRWDTAEETPSTEKPSTEYRPQYKKESRKETSALSAPGQGEPTSGETAVEPRKPRSYHIEIVDGEEVMLYDD